ncbi:type VII secretion system-associated protein [Streptomyces sp. NPDC052236]|uniref:type VII secretion system-associated protein n=1 Tax=Streptomyces sp. NPDC052236 TaxID=3365686 RepID=UPI0037D3B618
MANVTVLDSAFLTKFISNHIEPFAATLEAILKDSLSEGRAISFIANAEKTTTTISTTKPLTIGGMAGEKSAAGGGKVNTVIQQEATEILRIITDQTVLFEDFEEALRETVKQLEKVQGGNLEGIVPEDFMDIFEDVDSDLGNTGDDEE